MVIVAHPVNPEATGCEPVLASSLGSIAESSSSASKQAKNQPVGCLKDLATKARFRLLRVAANLLPNERIAQCQWRPVPLAQYVGAQYDPERQQAHYHNLTRCESYGCPICAYQRSEQDRHELSVAISQGLQMGMFPVLGTFTLAHDQADSLAELREAVAGAFDGCFSGSWYQRFSAEYSVIGKVKAWEAPYGKNGWHPHLHVLMFLGIELAGKWLAEFEAAIKSRWLDQLQRRGYSATWEHGVDVRTAESDIADYIAKFGREPLDRTWGADSELAKLPVKKNRAGGLTPFELLAAAGGDTDELRRLAERLGIDDLVTVKKRAGALYREYFQAFKGRPRLYWGKMRRVLELDEALYQFEQDNPREVESFTVVMVERGKNWNHVAGSGGQDLRAELLNMVRAGDLAALESWLLENHVEALITDIAREKLGSKRYISQPENVTKPKRPPDQDFHNVRMKKPPGDGWRPVDIPKRLTDEKRL